jgi:hypothetical protein
MMISWWNHTITVVHAELIPDPDGSNYGNEILDWDNATSTEVEGCHVQPVEADEQVDPGRDTITTRWRLFAPDGTAIAATDRIVYAGATYEIDGAPNLWPSATGTLDHVEAFLVRTDG